MSYAAASGGGQESGLYKVVVFVGKVLAVGASVMGTPAFFGRTRGPIFAYLSDEWGPKVAEWLTWVMCGVEALAIYGFTLLTFTGLVIWMMAIFAARRL